MTIAPLLLSLKVASFATAIALVAGVLGAFVLARVDFPGRELLDSVLTLPLVLPPTIIGYYLIVVVGRNGLIGHWLEEELGVRLIFSWQGAVVAASVMSLPLVLKSARAAFEGVPKELEDAARTLGKAEGPVFFLVTLPLAWRGILAGTMLAFARAMGEFGATLMVAGDLPGRTQTISMAVYDAVQSGDQETGAALMILTSVVCITILVASGRLLKPSW